MRTTGLAALVIGLSACAAPWTRPNTSDEQFRRDYMSCNDLAEALHPMLIPNSTRERPPAMLNVTGPAVQTRGAPDRLRTIADCMRQRGYLPA